MITTVEEVRKLFKDKTEAEIEFFLMYLNADAELRSLIKHVIKRVSEDPDCIEFTKDWQGTAEELRIALAQI